MNRARTAFLLFMTLSIQARAEDIPHPAGCDIKSNIGQNKRLYYLPENPRYEQVDINRKGERWFCSEDEALAANWKPAGSIEGRTGKTKPRDACIIPPEAPSPDCAIKGNLNSKREGIYHVPCSKYYDKTEIRTEDGERWFCSEDEAVRAGWRRPRS